MLLSISKPKGIKFQSFHTLKCLKQNSQLDGAKKLIFLGGHAYDKQASTVFPYDPNTGGGVERD